MKIWFISDTHNQHEGLQVPGQVDAVVHCGDESMQRRTKPNEFEARAFFRWYEQLDIPTKIFVPGNHSTAIEKGLILPAEYPTIQFLIHELWEWEGIKIFGSPYTPLFFDWAYNIPRKNLAAIWQTIPAGIDILVTHGPPKGILDVTRDWKTAEPIHIGSQSLTREVANRIQPKVHAFGHLHDEEGIRNFGTVIRNATQYINCSCCNLHTELVNHGCVVEL